MVTGISYALNLIKCDPEIILANRAISDIRPGFKLKPQKNQDFPVTILTAIMNVLCVACRILPGSNIPFCLRLSDSDDSDVVQHSSSRELPRATASLGLNTCDPEAVQLDLAMNLDQSQYAALIDEISKELRKKGLGLKMYENLNIDSLLWMDDVCLIHHDLETLQEMLDMTNHVALKYHIQFGAAKCKVIRKGKGKKSKLKLNGETLEDVTTYKYLGEIINNKGNLSDHISEVEKKIRGATSKILAETGNKEFKGIKMTAVWQMVDAILIPILTYACEAWTPNKEEITKLQTIFNEALKTILSIPKGTPTTILLNETGNYPIELTIKKKKILHAKRIDSLKDEALIKDVTSPRNSEWRKEIDRIAEEFNVKDQMTVLTKTSLKKHLHEEIKTKFMDHIENEYVEKTKIKHWKDLKTDITSGKRPWKNWTGKNAQP